MFAFVLIDVRNTYPFLYGVYARNEEFPAQQNQSDECIDDTEQVEQDGTGPQLLKGEHFGGEGAEIVSVVGHGFTQCYFSNIHNSMVRPEFVSALIELLKIAIQTCS